MRQLAITFTILVASAFSAGATADETSERPPEVQVLDYFIGTWDEYVTSQPTAQSPQASKSTVVTMRTWSLGGKLVRAVGTWQPAKTEFLHLVNYDPVTKVYRSWYFDTAGGIPRESVVGNWDEKTRTMTWRSSDEAGNKTVGTERCIDKDHYEWTHVVTTLGGKVVIDLVGKCTRRADVE